MAEATPIVAILAMGVVAVFSIKLLVENDQASPITVMQTMDNKPSSAYQPRYGRGVWTRTQDAVASLTELNMPGSRYEVRRTTGEFGVPAWQVKNLDTNQAPFLLYRLPAFLRGNPNVSTKTF